MVRILSILFLLIGFPLGLLSQSVNYVEYFWDEDPGVKNGTEIAISPGDFVSTIQTLETTDILPGFHNLYIRVCDENESCSLYEPIIVLIQDNTISIIEQAEYFWNMDPGIGNGNPLSLAPEETVLESYNFETNGLDHGYHRLYIRVRDDQNRWSLYDEVLVLIYNPDPIIITEMEYFWDLDPGVGSGTPIDISTGEMVSGNFSVNSNGLELGDHWLHVCVKDLDGAWSLYHRVLINVCSTWSPLADYEFVLANGEFVFTETSSFAESISWQVNGTEQGTGSEFSISPEGEVEVCLIVTNECGADTLCSLVGAPFIDSIDPDVLENDGTQGFSIFGYGLNTADAVEIRLNGEELTAASFSILSGEQIDTDFNFSEETIGFWDVVVTLEDQTELVLVEGLELFTTLDLDSEINLEKVILFPNPATDLVTIKGVNVKTIEVLNVNGTVVLKASGSQFSVEEIASGIYTVRIFDSDEEIHIVKLLIN